MGSMQMTVNEVKEARRLAWLGETVRDIAHFMGHTYTVTWNAVRGKSWSTVGNPPPVPGDYAPVVYRVCTNEHCGELYRGHPAGGLCQACYSYVRRNDGETRVPGELPIGRRPMDIGDLAALYRRYQCGESIEAIVADLDCSPETLRRRFRMAGYKMRANTAHNRVLTAGEVAQARTMHYDDGMPIYKIAEHFDINYLTMLDAVKWRTWRTAGGPLPEEGHDDEGRPCPECGLLTTNEGLCSYCREEARSAGAVRY